MTRPPAPLGHHLLTRSDLDQLGIQAERVRTWLASGWLDQVGSLPGGDDGDPIFAVLSRELRDELASRLLELGKDKVVFSPTRVHSLLARATQMQQSRREAAATAPTEDPVADALLDPAMAEALHRVACTIEDEVELLLALAREEARLEALEQATQTAAEANFFDAAALEEELGLWEPADAPGDAGEPAPAAPPPPAPADQPVAAAEPEIHEEETMSEPTLHPEDQTAMDRTAEDALDALFGPSEPGSGPAAKLEPGAGTADEALEVDLPPLDPVPPTETAFDEPAPEPAEQPVQAAAGAESMDSIGSIELDESITPIDSTEQEAPVVADACAETTSMLAMQKVESFLGELRHVLVELAQRPAAPPIDVQPLVEAVHRGFADLSEHAKASDSALTAVTDRLGQFGDKLEHGAALAVHAALGVHGVHGTPAAPPAPAPAAPTPPTFVVARADRSTAALYAIGFLLLCWSGILWFKTGNPQLAFATLVGANLIGCCVLIGRGRG